jgi:hypothetical protein
MSKDFFFTAAPPFSKTYFRTVTSGGSRNFEKGEGGHVIRVEKKKYIFVCYLIALLCFIV